VLTVNFPFESLVTLAMALEVFVSETICRYFVTKLVIPAPVEAGVVSIVLKRLTSVGTLVLLKAETYTFPTPTTMTGVPPTQFCVVPLNTIGAEAAAPKPNAASNMKADLITIIIS
jgi:hypothetical protein